MGEKDHKFKILVAWADIKIKVATLVLVANGAAFATAFAFVKDAGPTGLGRDPMNVAAIGMLFGAIAIRIV
jgi:hypothetical protein